MYGKLFDERGGSLWQDRFASALLNLGSQLHRDGKYQEALVPATQAAAHFKELGQRYAAAYRPNLAKALAVLADVLLAIGRVDEAISMDRQAIEVLAPPFRDFPETYRDDMFNYCKSYGEKVRAAGQEVDRELLEPILVIFDRLYEEDQDGR
jgi:tetratricopeptide (TPR) repeat protein